MENLDDWIDEYITNGRDLEVVGTFYTEPYGQVAFGCDRNEYNGDYLWETNIETMPDILSKKEVNQRIKYLTANNKNLDIRFQR